MNGEAFGVPREFVPIDLAKYGFKNMPPGAMDAYLRAFERVGMKPKQQPPLRRHMKSAKPSNLKGSNVPAATATTKPKQTPASPSAPALASQPRYIAPNLRAFDSPEAALRAGRAIQATVSKVTNYKNPAAEVYCRSRGIDLLAIATTAAPTSGGYLVPDELSRTIITIKSRVGLARQLALIVPMTSGVMDVPIEMSGLTVSYIGEAVAPGATDVSWGSIALNVKKRGVLGYVSQELNDDALIRFTDIYADRAGHALAKREDVEFILGDGTATYGGEAGLISSIGSAGVVTAPTGHTTWLTLDLADFVTCMAKLPEAFADGRESWICSAAFYATSMLRVVGGASQGLAADGRPLFLGKPVNIFPSMPATTAVNTIACLYGNWSESAAIGDRNMTFAFSDKAPSTFDRDLVAMRAFARYDINVFNNGDASTPGAYVALKTAAS